MSPLNSIRASAAVAVTSRAGLAAVARAPVAPPPLFKQALGRFSYGLDPSTRRPWTPAALQAQMTRSPALTRDVKATLATAKATVGTPLPTLTIMYSEGLLASDPRKIKSGAVTRRFPEVYSWAVAARMGPPELQAKAAKATITTLLSYTAKYKPTGNPINEHNFLPMFQAADLVMPMMTAPQQKAARAWLHSFITAAEHYPLQGMRKVNNWKTFSLQIRGTAAQALGDTKALSKTSHELDTLLEATIRADGSSLDFHHRDAFHYHLYNSEALMDLAMYLPGAVSDASKRRIEKTFEFIKPYYLGQKTHVEFAHSKVAFDRYRATHGEAKYKPHPWNPREADALLQRARALFPSLRPWSQLAEENDAGIRNELGASMRWPARG